MTDIAEMPDDELAALRVAVNAEWSRRRTLARASAAADTLSREIAEASGVREGDPWQQPTTMGFPVGWELEHKGKRWRSLIPNNVWEPGVAGWREVMADGSPPPYRQPGSAADAYWMGEAITWTDGKVYVATRNGVAHSPAESQADWRKMPEPVDDTPDVPDQPENPPTGSPWATWMTYYKDDYVTYDGKTYRVRQMHASQPGWEPPNAPALFELVDTAPTDPEPDPEPEPEAPGPPAWNPNGHAYKVGDLVDYGGVTYRVRQAHTSQAGWTPPAVASLYERVT